MDIGAAVSGINLLVVSPDGAVAYGYDKSRSELYVIKGLKEQFRVQQPNQAPNAAHRSFRATC